MKKLSLLTLAALFSFMASAQDAEKYQKYLGNYIVENAPFEKIIISMQGGSFWGEAVGQGESELLESDVENTFELEVAPGASLVFKMDERNIVNSLTLTIDDNAMEGMRIFPSLTDYVGHYKFEDGGPIIEMKVGEKNGLLTVESAEFGKSTIENTSRIDIFYESNYDSDLMFQRNDEDMVTGININVKSQGMILRAERELPEKEEVAELEEVAEEEMSLNLYAGKYEFNDMGFTLTIENRDGRLYASSDQGEGFMEPTDIMHKFEADGMDVSIEFMMSEEGEITELVLNYQGTPMSGTPTN
jgi:hypothetical protein